MNPGGQAVMSVRADGTWKLEAVRDGLAAHDTKLLLQAISCPDGHLDWIITPDYSPRHQILTELFADVPDLRTHRRDPQCNFHPYHHQRLRAGIEQVCGKVIFCSNAAAVGAVGA